MKTPEEKIAVMQHYLNGGAVLFNGEVCRQITGQEPLIFNWGVNDYSIYEEPKSKPSIDWSHVPEKFQWLAVDEDGFAYLYVDKPEIVKQGNMWDAQYYYSTARAVPFGSFNPGNCDWKDSLVQRPK